MKRRCDTNLGRSSENVDLGLALVNKRLAISFGEVKVARGKMDFIGGGE